MKISEKIKPKTKLKLEPGFKQFLWKMGIFIVLFVAIQVATIPLQTISLPIEYYKVRDTDIGKALLLTIMVFFFLSLERLKKLETTKFELKSTLTFALMSLLSFVGYFIFKNFLGSNVDIALENLWLFLILKYIILIISAIFLLIAIFGTKLFKIFIKKFRKELLISFLLFILALFLIDQFQKLWVHFSYIIAHVVSWLLNLISKTTLTFSGYLPIIDFNNFRVAIDKPCSGIDSMLMFIFLYVFIAGYDWSKFNKKKLLIMFIPGIISVFILNIVRIYLLIIIGAFISQSFALGFFHTSASMIIFLAYFILFWGLFYKWMKIK